MKRRAGSNGRTLAPDVIYKNIKASLGYGPDEKISRTTMKEGQDLFPREEVQGGGAQVRHGGRSLARHAVGGRRLVHARRERIFLRPVSQGPRHYGGLLKKYTNTRHLDVVVRRELRWASIGAIVRRTPTWPVTPNLTDNTRPMFDAFGYAVQAYERVRMYDPTGPLAATSLLALGNAYFRHNQFENAAYNTIS